jgi:hypothetical protein
MNKAALITVGKKFHEDSVFLLSVFDLEPSGVIIHAYNQTNSKEYSLPVTEMEVRIFCFEMKITLCVSWANLDSQEALKAFQISWIQSILLLKVQIGSYNRHMHSLKDKSLVYLVMS